VAATPEPTLALAQARARWGDGVAVAGLFRPGPVPDARTALGKAVSRQANRRRSHLPPRMLVAIDGSGRASLCPYVPDAQGGHPEGDDLYTGPFEELGAVTSGPLALVVLLAADRPCVLEAVWLDVEAATVAALLTGEPLPDEPELLAKAAEEDEDDSTPFTQTLLAQAELAQARADALLAQAHAALAEEAEETGRQPPGPPPAASPEPPEPVEPPGATEPRASTEAATPPEPIESPEHPEPTDPPRSASGTPGLGDVVP